MWRWLRQRLAKEQPAPARETRAAISFPWYSAPLILAGQPNSGQRRPDELDALAEDGAGIYSDTAPVWGSALADVTRRLSIETQAGGVLFFERYSYTPERFAAMAQLVGVRGGDRYQVIARQAQDPLHEGYWSQWRFISDAAWGLYYRQGADSLPPTGEGIVERMARTIEAERTQLDAIDFDAFLSERYGQHYEGSIGYGFGFLVENSYYGIYRLWSRVVFYSK